MSDASLQRSRVFQFAAPRPLPAGLGFMIGAAASLCLWSALVWLGLQVAG